MIIVYENNCQVQSDIFFMREESKNVDKQAWKFDINSGAREPACGQGGKEKAGLRVRECLPLIERRDKKRHGILLSMRPVLPGGFMMPEK